MSGPTPIEGGCLCGTLRYRIEGPVAWVAHCHCANCRRANGAVAVTWATVRREDFKLVRGAFSTYRSSSFAERSFCPRCGSQITFGSDREPGHIDVALGSLDHPEAHPADRHTWAPSRLSWLRLDEHLPSHREGSPEAATG